MAETETAEVALAAKNLTVNYGEVVALQDVNLTLPTGRITGLIGVNGAGKSTLLNAILGQVRPARGTLCLFGAAPVLARRAGRVAMVPQANAIVKSAPWSIRDVVMTGLYPRLGQSRRPDAKAKAAVEEALNGVDMVDLVDRPFGALSGGQRQRVLVARAIAQQADLILLDEPFAGVDVASEQLLMQTLCTLQTSGHTIIVSTHHLAQARNFCDDAILLKTKVLDYGPARKVLNPEALVASMGIDELSAQIMSGALA